MKQDILNLENKNVGSIELNDAIFGLDVRADILHRVVNWQLARLQAGTHKTKGRSEVALTPAKPFKQKGSGNARQGSRKGTQFRKGGVVFGPVVRDHSHELTKKFRKLGLKTALSAKAKEGNLVIIDEAKLSAPKTKDLKVKLDACGLKNCLFIDGKEVDVNFALASRNIAGVDVLPTIGANVYDILRKDKLVLTKDAETEMSKSAKTNNVTAAMYDTLVRPVITEKSMLSSEAGKVTFLVPLSASKEDVKAAVEAIFNVKVNKVNTIRQFGKTKRFRGYEGQRSDYKKALVTLADGQNIDVTTGI